MKKLYFVLLFILAGCWSGQTVTRDRQVPFTPKPIKDSADNPLTIQSSTPCDSLVRKAVSETANYFTQQQTLAGDRWWLESSAKLDSVKSHTADSVSLYYRMKKTISVQPRKDSVLVPFIVKEMKPLNFWDQFKAAAAVPSLVLNILQALFLFACVKWKIV